MATDTDDTMIVRSTIDLAHNLGLETVAEGVEDEETRQLLHQLGCDAIQGYHLTRPLNARDMTNWLRQRVDTNESIPRWEPLAVLGHGPLRSLAPLASSHKRDRRVGVDAEAAIDVPVASRTGAATS
jgi:predicted signal transduction protein with EAL and GGDEF domain